MSYKQILEENTLKVEDFEKELSIPVQPYTEVRYEKPEITSKRNYYKSF